VIPIARRNQKRGKTRVVTLDL